MNGKTQLVPISVLIQIDLEDLDEILALVMAYYYTRLDEKWK